MSNYNDIRNHTFLDLYNNNVQIDAFSAEGGLDIFGTKFHNFSFAVTTGTRPASATPLSGGAWTIARQRDISNAFKRKPQNNYSNTTANSSWELMSTIVPMLYACWNGAEIQKAYWSNSGNDALKPAQGSSVIINNTPEFLGIFNNVCIALYDNIISRQGVYDDIMGWHDQLNYISSNKDAIKTLVDKNADGQLSYVSDNKETIKNLVDIYNSKTNSIHASYVTVQEVATNASNLLPTIKLEDREILDIIYRNTGTTEITIKYSSSNGTIDAGPINPGAKLVIPTGAEDLEAYVPRYGYGEISFLRIGNNIYVRAI